MKRHYSQNYTLLRSDRKNLAPIDRAIDPEEVIIRFLLIGATHMVWRNGQISG